NEIARMKKEGNATQDKVANYASAAVTFLEHLNSYKPDKIYDDRILKLKTLLSGMPMNMKFSIVEWKTLHEGIPIPNVTIWEYNGSEPISVESLSTERKLKRFLSKESESLKKVAISDTDGTAEVELDRDQLPEGFLFCPEDIESTKVIYISMVELMRQSQGTYMQRQFRLKMFTK
ncbi:MAG: hypothetical protein ACRCY5_06025, partial [Phocaeicola sp.]